MSKDIGLFTEVREMEIPGSYHSCSAETTRLRWMQAGEAGQAAEGACTEDGGGLGRGCHLSPTVAFWETIYTL